MVNKVVSYLRFIAGGISTKQGIGFIAEEVRAKSRRISNARIRRRFDAASASDYLQPSLGQVMPKLRVLSLCHAGGTPEQKLSILSFLRQVGVPRRWSVVSDGSITGAQADSLRALHPCVEVVDWSSFLSNENRRCYEEFARYTIFAKKFVVESNLPVDGVTLYTDSDILFLEGGFHLRALVDQAEGKSYYQQDLPGYLDPSLLTETELEAPPLNAGFVIQGKRIDWGSPIIRLESALALLTPAQKGVDLEKYEQAIAHIAHVSAGSEPLDSRYALQVSDRLDKGDLFAGPEYVMRHYTRPVRHKMWLHASEYLS